LEILTIFMAFTDLTLLFGDRRYAKLRKALIDMERRYANEERNLDGRYANEKKGLDAVEWRYANEEKDLDVVNLPSHEENDAMGVCVDAKSMTY